MKTILAVIAVLALPITGFGMGNTPDNQPLNLGKPEQIQTAPRAEMPQEEAAIILSYNSDATQAQKDNATKALLGKSVEWEIIVAELAEEKPNVFLIQGRSDKKHIGVFCYIQTNTPSERDRILHLSKGSTCRIQGVVHDMTMRHFVITPARLID